jgi:hypothetical protein
MMVEFPAKKKYKSANIPLESIKYPAELQLGFISFTTPSYKKCHPIKILSTISKIACQFV